MLNSADIPLSLQALLCRDKETRKALLKREAAFY